MKACLMKVNYDPRYTTPHIHQSNQYFLKNRLALAHETYGASRTDSKPRPSTWDDSGIRAKARQKLSLDLSLQKKKQGNDLYAKTGHEKGVRVERVEMHKEGVAKAHTTIRLQPLKPSSNKTCEQHHPALHKPLPVPKNMKSLENKLQKGSADPSPRPLRLFAEAEDWVIPTLNKNRSYSPDKLPRRPSHSQGPTAASFEKRHFWSAPKTSDGTFRVSHSDGGFCLTNRSRTTIGPGEYRYDKSSATLELEQKARREAEHALRSKKIFTILGPYHSLRVALRRRGWVEKFANAPPPSEISGKVAQHVQQDHSDDGDAGRKDHPMMPWEEDDGIYGMMSHVIRNCTPSLVFSVKSVDVSSRMTKSGQLVNHFGKASMFTTKSGLCQNLRSVPWYEDEDPDTFYPRCYKLDDDDDKDNFVDDFRLTACISLLKWFVDKYQDDDDKDKSAEGSAAPASSRATPKTSEDHDSVPGDGSETSGAPSSSSVPQSDSDHGNVTVTRMGWAEGSPRSRKTGSRQESPADTIPTMNLSRASPDPRTTSPVMKEKVKTARKVPLKAIDVALQQCQRFLRFKDHKDIDIMSEDDMLAETQWDKFLMWFYHCIHDGGYIASVHKELVQQCKLVLSRVKLKWSQFELDGCNNIWILKPGAKSRGRGIQCLDKLSEILKAASAASMVVQKYMERPLLVYNTKFDIRQWFMVTDWNPLTVWYYKHCYLRFCTQEYTLDNFHESIHLSNNSVQKHYSNGIRSSKLPDDNMWSSDEFDEYLQEKGHGAVWQNKVVPGMKKALLCSLLCTQEFIECRKSAFEVYGADFMVTQDLQPWLLEINCSPSMARNTRVTCKMVDMVLDDTLKVVLDRKADKSCDTGGFECIYKQSTICDPPSTDANLTVYGKKVRKPRR